MDTAEPVLAVAAQRREFGALLKNGIELLNWPVDFAARYGRWLLVANGAGPDRAAEAVDRAVAMGPVAAVVSTGYCGALDDRLLVADIVVATEVNGARAEAPASARKFAAGPIVSVDRVVQTVEEKGRLRTSGAIAVEMEAAGVSDRAMKLGLPFYCVRVVTDRADETLSIDFNAARDRSGRIRTSGVIQEALRHPWVGISELLRLARRSRIAARALGDFLADCRIQ
jgi:nucleoside phosphorylase